MHEKSLGEDARIAAARPAIIDEALEFWAELIERQAQVPHLRHHRDAERQSEAMREPAPNVRKVISCGIIW